MTAFSALSVPPRPVLRRVPPDARLWRVWVALSLLMSVCDMCRADGVQFEAVWSDGTVMETAEDVQAWASVDDSPTLAGRPLLAPENPVQWLSNATLPVAPRPDAFLEFFGGDRLPGQIVRIEPPGPGESGGTAFVVEPAVTLTSPNVPTQRLVRVDSRFLRRIVLGGDAEQRLDPGSAFLRDGRRLTFTTLRFLPQQVRFLTDSGIVSVNLADLNELHLPELNGWSAYYRLLAAWNPTLDQRMVQLETSAGLQVTASLAAFRPAHYGDRTRSESWHQIVQPVWSRQPLWVRFATVREWRFFAPDRVPLTLMQPVSVRRTPIFGDGWDWQVNRTVTGGRAVGPRRPAGWGFGVHGDTQLNFALPATARSFRTQLFLDRSVGTGGCVKGRVMLHEGQDGRLDGSEDILFESDLLIGNQAVAGSGELEFPAGDTRPAQSALPSDAADADVAAAAADAPVDTVEQQGTRGRELSLQLDAVRNPPPGADPYDIRDLAVWAEPSLKLDPLALRQAVIPHIPAQSPALDGWQIAAGELVADVVWDEANWLLRGFRRLTAPRDRFVVLTRTLSIESHRWFYVHAFREREDSPEARVQLRVDGRVIGEQRIPHRSGAFLPDPLLFPVTELQGQTVECELIVICASAEPSVTWQATGLSIQRPTLQPLVDEGGPLELQLDASLPNRYTQEQPFWGESALLCGPPGVRLEAAERRLFRIREFPAVGEFRFLQFAWKKVGGAGVALGLGNAGYFGNEVARATLGNAGTPGGLILDRRGMQNAYRYFAGRWDDPDFMGLRVADRIPAEWQIVTRDLFGDFGAVNLSGLELLCPDGEQAVFDAVYLARTQDALAQIVPERDPSAQSAGNAAAERPGPSSDDFRARLRGVAPGFGLAGSGDEPVLLPQFGGRGPVLRLHPVARDVPCRLTRVVKVAAAPAGSSLKLGLTHHGGADWQLNVLLNGEPAFSQLVDAKSTTDGWLDTSIDLNAYAGQTTLVEVECHSNDWSDEWAYISAVLVE